MGAVRHDISVNQDYRNRCPKLKKSENSWPTFAIPVLYTPFFAKLFPRSRGQYQVRILCQVLVNSVN